MYVCVIWTASVLRFELMTFQTARSNHYTTGGSINKLLLFRCFYNTKLLKRSFFGTFALSWGRSVHISPLYNVTACTYVWSELLQCWERQWRHFSKSGLISQLSYAQFTHSAQQLFEFHGTLNRHLRRCRAELFGFPEFTSDIGATANCDANARCIIIEHTYSEISIIRGHNFVRRGTPIIWGGLLYSSSKPRYIGWDCQSPDKSVMNFYWARSYTLDNFN